MKAILVEWEDACSRDLGPWVDKQDWHWEPKIVMELGFVLYDGPEGLIITSAYNESQLGPVTQIPRGMVRNITEL